MSSIRASDIVQRTECGGSRDRAIRYTIATLVNDPVQYAAMLASFRGGGFSTHDCEYLFIDNTTLEQVDAFRGLNALLNAARGTFVILCHQDVRLLSDGREALDARLAELEAQDPCWALAGNAGGTAPGRLAIRITDPHGANRTVGSLPARVTSLDENFIIVRADARLSFSRDLTGFHFYGADICLVADVLGWNAYVIDFHLLHLSAGNKTALFGEMEETFRAKWARALAPRWIQTTCSLVRLAGTPFGKMAGRLTEGPLRMISRRLAGATGWTIPAKPPAR